MQRYEWKLAAACVRGAAKKNRCQLPESLLEKDLNQLTQQDFQMLLQAGEQADLRMYHFKKKEQLPRVKAVLGILKGIQPESLLDVGSGRGVFLFPFLEEFPWIPVTAAEILPHRVKMLQDISDGGIDGLSVVQQDITCWDQPEASFDVVTILEVLEHIPQVEKAVEAVVRLAKRYVVVSVPSKPDDNPEHIHLLTKDVLTQLFTKAGCQKLSFSGVNGHLIMLAKKG